MARKGEAAGRLAPWAVGFSRANRPDHLRKRLSRAQQCAVDQALLVCSPKTGPGAMRVSALD